MVDVWSIYRRCGDDIVLMWESYKIDAGWMWGRKKKKRGRRENNRKE